MNLIDESYDDVTDQALKELRDEVERPKIEHKKMIIYT
jgi:DNA-directed RNA polymerase subunit K/omega